MFIGELIFFLSVGDRLMTSFCSSLCLFILEFPHLASMTFMTGIKIWENSRKPRSVKVIHCHVSPCCLMPFYTRVLTHYGLISVEAPLSMHTLQSVRSPVLGVRVEGGGRAIWSKRLNQLVWYMQRSGERAIFAEGCFHKERKGCHLLVAS